MIRRDWWTSISWAAQGHRIVKAGFIPKNGRYQMYILRFDWKKMHFQVQLHLLSQPHNHAIRLADMERIASRSLKYWIHIYLYKMHTVTSNFPRSYPLLAPSFYINTSGSYRSSGSSWKLPGKQWLAPQSSDSQEDVSRKGILQCVQQAWQSFIK